MVNGPQDFAVIRAGNISVPKKNTHFNFYGQSPVLLEVYDSETYCNPGGNIQNMERKEGNLIGCNLYCADHPCYQTLIPQSTAVM
jgi:hypothetical protein